MNKTFTVSLGFIVTLSIAVLVGFIWGRNSVELPVAEKITEIQWKDGPEVHDTIWVPEPYEVKVPEKVPVFVPTDTAALFAVWCDYYLERKYSLDFSNDSLGMFKVDALINQNKLIIATSEIRPRIKTITEREVIYKVPTFQFYALIGSSVDFKTNKIQFGVDLKNRWMIGASGIRMNDQYGYTIDFGIKFR